MFINEPPNAWDRLLARLKPEGRLGGMDPASVLHAAIELNGKLSDSHKDDLTSVECQNAINELIDT